MNWNTNTIAPQIGRVAIVTGANAGLGYDVARTLASHGAEVIMACRNTEKGEQAKANILTQTKNANIHVWQLDLASLESVKTFAYKFTQQYSQLDLLINNAGVMMPPFSLTADGFESQLAANYIGHFALTAQLLPLLEATLGSRTVSLSSLAHKAGKIQFDDINFEKDYNAGKAYNQAKLACLMFAFELQRHLTANNCQTISVAAHPGVSMTNLDQHLGKISAMIFKLICQPSEKGALPTLYAALGDDIKGGDFCGPNGWFELKGEPVTMKAKAHAYDLGVAERLWGLSESMTGLNNFIPKPS